jgi:hypothetical protein
MTVSAEYDALFDLAFESFQSIAPPPDIEILSAPDVMKVHADWIERSAAVRARNLFCALCDLPRS